MGALDKLKEMANAESEAKDLGTEIRELKKLITDLISAIKSLNKTINGKL